MRNLPEHIQNARATLRDKSSDDPMYWKSITQVYEHYKALTPDIDMYEGALFTFVLGLYLLLTPECERACVHEFGRVVAMLGDRLMIDHELEHHVRT